MNESAQPTTVVTTAHGPLHFPDFSSAWLYLPYTWTDLLLYEVSIALHFPSLQTDLSNQCENTEPNKIQLSEKSVIEGFEHNYFLSPTQRPVPPTYTYNWDSPQEVS